MFSDSYSPILVEEVSTPVSTVCEKLVEASALTLTAFTGKDAPTVMDVSMLLDMFEVCLLNSSNSCFRVVRDCSLTVFSIPHVSFDPGVRRATGVRWTEAFMLTFRYVKLASFCCHPPSTCCRFAARTSFRLCIKTSQRKLFPDFFSDRVSRPWHSRSRLQPRRGRRPWPQ